MKIKPEHYKYIKEEISKIPPEDRKRHFELLKNDPRVIDIQKRFRWDCFYAAKLTAFACDTLYLYCDDEHIDTALRKIISELYN